MKASNNSFAVAPLCVLALCLAATPAAAQKGKIIKSFITPQAVKKSAGTAIRIKPLPEFTNASGIRLNPLGTKHSITPSAGTILGSEKVLRPGTNISAKKIERTFITARERAPWREVRDMFVSIAYLRPAEPHKLSRYLRHPVPQETFRHIQDEYAKVLEKINTAKEAVNIQIIYASLPGEGFLPMPSEVGRINELVYPLINSLRELRTALPDEPYLTKQQEVWEKTFAVFNPLLAGAIVSPTATAVRQDARTLDSREFNLFNPDGTDYLLPRSETLLVDPDEMDEMESYAAVREKMRNPPITRENAEIERAKLLEKIPANLRIALINDDTLPRVNFENWGKLGYLGKGARIDTFSEGQSLMSNIRAGVKYDLIITDLLVPFGGIAMMPQLRELDKKAVVIASSKFDRGEEDEQKLFDLGFDGYLWYNSNLNEGAYGYIEYLRGMSNYYHYKQLHGWSR